MDISKLKEFVQSVLKNYSSLLVPAAIGLAAVVVFIPTQLMSGKLRRQMEKESIKPAKRTKTLNATAVSRRQHEEEAKYQTELQQEANEVQLRAQRTTQRELLSYKIFPEPKDRSTLIFDDFGEHFRNGVRDMYDRLNAGDCPSDIERERALQGLSTTGPRRRSPLYGIKGSMGMTRARLREASATIIDVLCQDKAESVTVYANQLDVSGYEFWEAYEHPGRDEAIKDCWYWQLAYWTAEDVIDTIHALNSKPKSESVLTSPVKRLVSISFGREAKRRRTMSKTKTRSAETIKAERPKYVLSLEDALVWPCTGRYCSEDVDVVHFNIVVVVSSRAILHFMEELCSAKEHKFRGWDGQEQEQVFEHNQITILESKIQSINHKNDLEHEYYRYGEDAVVELTLVCEYILNTAAYGTVKPKAVMEGIKEKLKKIEDEKAKKDRLTLRKERTKKAKSKAGKKGKSRGRDLDIY
jgi:hypothetical protein